jgi:hypothetical protein
MGKAKRTLSLEEKQKELEALEVRIVEVEKKMRLLLNDMDGNSRYRDDIIQLAGEINSIQQQMKKLG